MSLGGLGYHMGQFHVAQLFPAHHGLVSSLYVGAFVASGIIFEVVRAIFRLGGGSHLVYRGIMSGLGSIALPFAFIMAWMAPRAALKTFDRYHFSLQNFAFRVEPVHVPIHAALSEAASEAGATIGNDHGGRAGLCTLGNNIGGDDTASVIPPVHDPCSGGRSGVSEESRVDSGPLPVQLQAAADQQDPSAEMQQLRMEDKKPPGTGWAGKQDPEARLPERPPSGDVHRTDVSTSHQNTSAATELGREHELQVAKVACVSSRTVQFTSVSKAGVAHVDEMIGSTTGRPVHARFVPLDTCVSLTITSLW